MLQVHHFWRNGTDVWAPSALGFLLLFNKMFLFSRRFAVWLSATPSQPISGNGDPGEEIPVLHPLSQDSDPVKAPSVSKVSTLYEAKQFLMKDHYLLTMFLRT